jgi:hypothetical protein
MDKILNLAYKLATPFRSGPLTNKNKLIITLNISLAGNALSIVYWYQGHEEGSTFLPALKTLDEAPQTAAT